jgi:hypothetical protein
MMLLNSSAQVDEHAATATVTTDDDDVFELAFAAMRQSLAFMQAQVQRQKTQSLTTQPPLPATVASSPLPHPPPVPQDLITAQAALQSTESLLLQAILRGIERDAERQLHALQAQHVATDQRFQQLMHLHRQSMQQVEASAKRMLASCTQQRVLSSQRLQQQETLSDRRLQDLVFEVVGEYGKAMLRAQRREDYLRNVRRVDVVVCTWRLLWRRFTMRLRFDLTKKIISNSNNDNNRLAITHLLPERDRDELAHVLKRLSKKLGLLSEQSFVALTVLRVSRGERDTKTAKSTNAVSKDKGKDKERDRGVGGSVFCQQPVGLANYRRELSQLLEEVRRWIYVNPSSSTASASASSSSSSSSLSPTRGQRIQSMNISDIDRERGKQLLSNISFAWQSHSLASTLLWDQLLSSLEPEPVCYKQSPAKSTFDDKILRLARNLQYQYRSTLFNSRVYFCLEERCFLQSRGLIPMYSHDATSVKLTDKSNKFKPREISIQAIITALQELYCDFPHTASTLQSSSLTELISKQFDSQHHNVTDILLVELQRIFLSHPLCVKDFERKHQDAHRIKFPLSVPLRDDRLLLEELSLFPDVLRVNSLVDDTVLHFVPAPLVVLQEALQGHVPMPTLFVAMSCEGDNHRSDLLSYPTNLNQCSQLSAAMTGLQLSNSGAASTIPSPLVKPTENKQSVFVFPLNQSCMDSLQQCYFPNLPAKSDVLASDTAEANIDKEKDMLWSSLNILPDSIRRVGLQTSSSSRPTTHGNDRLQSSFALLADENSFLSAQGNSAGTEVNRINNNLQSVYYLIQLVSADRVKDDHILAGEIDPLNPSFHRQDNRGQRNKSQLDVELESTSYDDDTFEELSPRPLTRLQSTTRPSPTLFQDESIVFKQCIILHCEPLIGMELVVGGEKESPRLGHSKKGVADGSNTLLEDKSSQVDSDIGNVGKKSRNWDLNILSRLCYWRSCMCDTLSTATTTADSTLITGSFPSTVCRYHQELRLFLDTKSNGNNKGVVESSKYLPKKVPALVSTAQGEAKRDLMMIRAASTLLQELWDGRLRATVKLFSKKMISDIKLRSCFESQINTFLKYHGLTIARRRKRNKQSTALNDLMTSLIPSPPTWILWRNQDYLDK